MCLRGSGLAALVLLAIPICIVSLPTYETIEGAEVVWEKPPNPKGTLFVAHGCNHGAVDFWPQSDACTKCLGLPEEVNITKTALSRGYVVIAISSESRQDHKCWKLQGAFNPNTTDPIVGDVGKVMKILPFFQQRERLTTLPLYALGASSGGAFVLGLAFKHPLDAICSQIMALPPRLLDRMLGQGHRYPPVMFVHMPEDKHTASAVQEDMTLFTAAGINTTHIEVFPRPLTHTIFSDRIQGITPATSQEIVDAFKKSGMLDDAFLLVSDPRSSSWRKAILDANITGIGAGDLEPDSSSISEEMNLFYARHEIVGDTTSEMLDWFEHTATGQNHVQGDVV